MEVFLGIEFAGDFKGSQADFDKAFGSNHVFKRFLPKDKSKKLKEAYKIATSKVKDGNVSTTTNESKETGPEEVKK